MCGNNNNYCNTTTTPASTTNNNSTKTKTTIANPAMALHLHPSRWRWSRCRELHLHHPRRVYNNNASLHIMRHFDRRASAGLCISSSSPRVLIVDVVAAVVIVVNCCWEPVIECVGWCGSGASCITAAALTHTPYCRCFGIYCPSGCVAWAVGCVCTSPPAMWVTLSGVALGFVVDFVLFHGGEGFLACGNASVGFYAGRHLFRVLDGALWWKGGGACWGWRFEKQCERGRGVDMWDWLGMVLILAMLIFCCGSGGRPFIDRLRPMQTKTGNQSLLFRKL